MGVLLAFFLLLLAALVHGQNFVINTYSTTTCTPPVTGTVSNFEGGLCFTMAGYAGSFRYSSCTCTTISLLAYSDSSCTVGGSAVTYPISLCVSGATTSFFISGSCPTCATSPGTTQPTIGPLSINQVAWIAYGGLYAICFISGIVVFLCVLCMDKYKAPEREILVPIKVFFALGLFLAPLDAFSAILSLHSMAQSVPVTWRNSCSKVFVVIFSILEIAVSLALPVICCIFDLGYAGSYLKNLVSLCQNNVSTCISLPWWLLLVCLPALLLFWLICGIPRLCIVTSMAAGTFGGWGDRPVSFADNGKGKIELPDVSSLSSAASTSTASTNSVSTTSTALYSCLRCDGPTKTDLSLCENCAKIAKE